MPSILAIASAALLLVDGVAGARIARKATDAAASEGTARQTTLYTIGAPRLSKDGDFMQHPLSGCFPGTRFVNVQRKFLQPWDADIVPRAANLAGFKHPKTNFVKLDQSGKTSKYVTQTCGNEKFTIETSDIGLHDKGLYIKRIQALGGFAKTMANVGLYNSYDNSTGTVARDVNSKGWNLLGSALVTEKVSHLMQHHSNKKCILTFEGSETGQDWKDNLNAGDRSFCGLSQRVHKGFVEALMRIVEDSKWQNNIRAKLSSCSDVTVVGHSLGGAMATLFSACAGKPGSAAFNTISW